MYRILTRVLIILAALLAVSQPVIASSPLQATVAVGNGTPQSCTVAALRNAAAVAGTVVFNCGPNPVTIFITGGEITVNASKTIDGGGKVTLDAQNASRIFRTPTFANFVLKNITLKNGKAVPTGSNDRTYGQGGAIFVDVYTRLMVQNVTFLNNSSLSSVNCFGGGAIKLFGFNYAEIYSSTFTGNKAMNGGAINNLTSDLIISNSVFDSNEANYDHALTPSGLYCDGGGGAILVDGANLPKDGGVLTVRISNSTFRNNKSGQNGGGIFSYLYHGANMTIERSIFENNTAIMVEKPDGTYPTDAGMGGGLYLGGEETAQMLFTGKYVITNTTINNNHADFTGGGISLHAATLHMSNSTIANNEARNSYDIDYPSTQLGLGGGMAMFESLTVPTNTRFTNITIAGNTSGLTGGGIFGVPPGGSGAMKAMMENSVVANNTSGGSPVDCQRPLVDLGGNVQYPTPPTNGFGVKCTSSVLIGDPRLGALASNGGPTRTMALQSGSAAIGRAVNAYCPIVDQRGYGRNGDCDSGAFEYAGRVLTLKQFVPTALR